MEHTTAGTERSEPGDSEQDEEEDVYEVEKIIDMRAEEGEVLYRVRWKNYTSDEDTWEPEAHLEDCREVLLAYKKKLAEAKTKKDTGMVEEVQVEVTARKGPPQKLPMKSDLFDADSESEDERRATSPPKKKKKKKSSKEVTRDPSPDSYRRERRKKKKEKKRWKQDKVLPAPESDGTESEQEKPPTPSLSPSRSQKRLIESEEEEESPVSPKKQKRDKPKEGEKQKKEGGDGRKKKDHRKEPVSSEEEEEEVEEEEEEKKEEDDNDNESASMDGDPNETAQFDDGSDRSPAPALTSRPTPEKQQGEAADTSGANQKKNKPGLKLQGIKDLIQVKKRKKSPPSSPALAPPQLKLKKLMSGKSASDKSHGRSPRGGEKAETAPLSSDSSDAPPAGSFRKKSKGKEEPSSPSPSSSSSSGAVARDDDARPDSGLAAAIASGLGTRGKDLASSRQGDKAEKEQPASTNLFEKFLLHCEAKDRMPRRQAVHSSENRGDQNKTGTPKTSGRPERKNRPPKESAALKPEQEKTDKVKRDSRTPETSRPKQSLPAQETKPSEKKESLDSLADRRAKADGQGTQGKTMVEMDNEKREESLEKGRESREKREEPMERGRDSREKREEAREKREEPLERGRESREKREEPLERGRESREKREEPREKKEEPLERGREAREKREEPRERRGKPEEAHGRLRERKATDVASPERRRKREDSEPHLFGACDDNPEPQDRAPDRAQASLNLGVDIKLDWMTLEDFQKHLNGEDEILSTATITPNELRDAVKAGSYLAVKLALGSKEDYNLDQEDSSGMSLVMLAAAGGQDDILRVLIKKGVKVNWRQKNGTTALMHAAEKNFLSTVAILLEAGAHVNAQTLGGETALMKACKRGNGDVVRLLLEYGADCSILSKHQNNALHFAKLSNNMAVYDHVKEHTNTLWSVAEETIRAYFETRLALLEPVFPLACHRLCEGPDFSLDFNYKPPSHCPAEGSGILLFVFHANFLNEITARLCGPCSVHAVVLNDKFQLPIFLDSHFIYSFNPVQGQNKLFIRLAESPTAKVKLLICAYRVQLQ